MSKLTGTLILTNVFIIGAMLAVMVAVRDLSTQVSAINETLYTSFDARTEPVASSKPIYTFSPAFEPQQPAIGLQWAHRALDRVQEYPQETLDLQPALSSGGLVLDKINK